MSIGAVDRGNGAVPHRSSPTGESAPLAVAVNMGWHLAYHDVVRNVSQRCEQRLDLAESLNNLFDYLDA